MHKIAATCMALVVVAADLGVAHAQQRFAQAVLLACGVDGADGPAVLAFQLSTALEDLCLAPGEDNVVLCATLADVAGITPCATALARLNDVGTRQAASRTKTFLPSNFRIELGDFPASGRAKRPPESEADVIYSFASPDDDVSLVACDVSAGAPRLVAVQTSATNGDGSDAVSCADGLQARLDAGEMVGEAVVVPGWNPADKKAIVGAAKSESFIPDVGDEVLVGFAHGDFEQVVFVYTVLAEDRL